jgi:hypothetical integral membrane protein (TIGR02206 family)
MQDFTAYGPSHLAVIALLFAGAAALVMLGRARREPSVAKRDGSVFALAIIAFLLPLQAMTVARWGDTVANPLPLQLCDLASLVAPYALWSRRPVPMALTYYWGLTLTTQAVATPDLSKDFPDPVFILFWGMHLLIVWAAIYLTWGLGIVPDWHLYRITVAVTLAWMATVFVINSLTGSNYGYVNAKPAAASLLDYLGPWPTYLLVEVVIVSAVWALMTWPWVRLRTTRPQAANSMA